MKNGIALLLTGLLMYGCAVKKTLETTAPFQLGEPFGQKWVVEEDPNTKGYDVILPILSLNKNDAVLHNLYHHGEMIPVTIEMREIGMVAVAKFPSKEGPKIDQLSDGEAFPFVLGEAEAVLSYVQKKKVRYIKVNGIRQNPTIAYPSLVARRNN